MNTFTRGCDKLSKLHFVTGNIVYKLLQAITNTLNYHKHSTFALFLCE